MTDDYIAKLRSLGFSNAGILQLNLSRLSPNSVRAIYGVIKKDYDNFKMLNEKLPFRLKVSLPEPWSLVDLADAKKLAERNWITTTLDKLKQKYNHAGITPELKKTYLETIADKPENDQEKIRFKEKIKLFDTLLKHIEHLEQVSIGRSLALQKKQAFDNLLQQLSNLKPNENANSCFYHWFNINKSKLAEHRYYLFHPKNTESIKVSYEILDMLNGAFMLNAS